MISTQRSECTVRVDVCTVLSRQRLIAGYHPGKLEASNDVPIKQGNAA